MLDQFGQKIIKGSVITYPVRQGSDMWMGTMFVTSVDSDFGRIFGLVVSENCGWIDGDRIYKSPEKYLRAVVFYSPERCTVIPAEIVRKKYPLIFMKHIKNIYPLMFQMVEKIKSR